MSCVYIYVHVYMHIYIYIYMYMCVYVCVFVHTVEYTIYVFSVYIHVHACMSVCLYERMYAGIYVCRYVFLLRPCGKWPRAHDSVKPSAGDLTQEICGTCRRIHGSYLCFWKLGVVFVGVLIMRALPFGLHFGAPDFASPRFTKYVNVPTLVAFQALIVRFSEHVQGQGQRPQSSRNNCTNPKTNDGEHTHTHETMQP